MDDVALTCIKCHFAICEHCEYKRAVVAFEYILLCKECYNMYEETNSAIAELQAQIKVLTREKAIEHQLFLIEAEKHSEWLEKYMEMKVNYDKLLLSTKNSKSTKST